MRLLVLAICVAAAAAQERSKLPIIYRNQFEYARDTPCPPEYVEDTAAAADNDPNFKICTKGNIADCEQGTSWHLLIRRSNRCQYCVCDTDLGGIYAATCNKVTCADIPEGTPLPGQRQSILGERRLRQKCRRTDKKVCDPGSKYLARDRKCVYCDDQNKIQLSG